MGAAASAHDEACFVPVAVLASDLTQLLTERPQNTLPLSDLDVLLSDKVRQLAQEHGGLAAWLRCFPGYFKLSGQAGKESVSLAPGVLDPGGDGDGATTPPQTARSEPLITPLKSAPGADGGATRLPAAAFDELLDGQCAVQLRGLPYKATVEDIRGFLGDFASELAEESPIHLVLNRDGRPSGFARVLFSSMEAAQRCRDKCHLRSMQDRYVEVFLYTDRPRARHRRCGEETIDSPQKEGGVLESAVARELVMRECREVMADPKHGSRMLLSMLGVELSPGARACVKQIDNGLKHFLAQHPDEFSVDGVKGCEHVTYHPAGRQPGNAASHRREPPREAVPLQLSQALGLLSPTPAPHAPLGWDGWDALPPSPLREVLGMLPPPPALDSAWEAPTREAPPPSSPRPACSPRPTDRQAVHPTPRSALLMPPTPSSLGVRYDHTPSRWNSPAHQDLAPWQPQQCDTLPPWPGAPPPPPDCLQGLASGFAGDGGAAFAAMASAMSAAMAAGPFGAHAAWPVPPPAFPGFLGAAQPTWGAAEAAAAQPASSATLQPEPKAGAAREGRQAGRVWPGQPGGDGEAGLGSAVRLRGLPFSSSEQDVLAFFAQHDIVDRIAAGPKAVNLLVRTNGRPSGQAVVQMRDRGDAAIAQHLLDGKWMGSRYIEVFLHGEDGVEADAPGEGGPAHPSASGGQQPIAEGDSAQAAGAVAQGQATVVPDFGAQFGALPQWPAAGWGSPPTLGGPLLPGAAEPPPAMDSAWGALFESLGGPPSAAAHACAPLSPGARLPESAAGAVAGPEAA